ncbi:hypothetical protein DIPPA_23267 [Diplonema papillatum]|nr:hypothetical protein DIPPA_23267 [Diplonema papillatum]
MSKPTKVFRLQFFNATLPDEYRDVEFTRYLRKSQRRWLLQLLHLNKYSWLSLVVVIVAIAVLLDTSADSLRSSGELDIFYFVFTVGWGTLVFLFVIAGKTIGAFRAFCEQIDMSSLSPATYYRGAEVQFSSSRFFWFGRPQFTLQLLQMGLLYQVFYTAVVIVNIIPQAYAIPMGWVLVVMAFAPTIVIFAFLLPAMMPPFTCLASLGNFLDLDLLHTMSQSAETEPVETQRPALPKDFRSYFTKQYLLTSHLPNDMDDATPSSPMLQPA